MTRRLALLLVVLGLSIGAVVVPKLYWDDRPVPLTCAELEHADVVLEAIMTVMRTSAGPQCMPGEPECIAEAWMYYEADDLRTFLRSIHSVTCQQV